MAIDRCPATSKPGGGRQLEGVLRLLRQRALKLQTLVALGFAIKVTTTGLPALHTSTTDGAALGWDALDALDLRAAAQGAPLDGDLELVLIREPQVQVLHCLARMLSAVVDFANERGLNTDAALRRHIRRVAYKLGLLAEREEADFLSQRFAMALCLGVGGASDKPGSDAFASAVVFAQRLVLWIRPSSFEVFALLRGLTRFELQSAVCDTLGRLLRRDIPLTSGLGFEADAADAFRLLPFDAVQELLERLVLLGLLPAAARGRALALLGTNSFYFPLALLESETDAPDVEPEARLLLEGSEWPSRLVVVDKSSGEVSDLLAAPELPAPLFPMKSRLPATRNLVIQRPPKFVGRCRVYFVLTQRAARRRRGLPDGRQPCDDI